MKKFMLGLTVLSLTLAGCSGTPVERIEEHIANQEFEDAKEWLNDELEDEPENPLYHTLMAETLLSECAYTNCFDKNPDALKPLSQHFQGMKDGQFKDGDMVVDLIARINNKAYELINSKHHPKALANMNFMAAFGPVLQNLTLITFNKASDHIIDGDIPPASTLLGSLSNKIILKDPNQAMAMLLNGYIINDTDMINNALNNFEKAEKDVQINERAIQALPYAIFQQMIENDANNGTETFVNEVDNIIKIANIPYFNTERGQAEIANAIYAMTRNEKFLDRAILHMQTSETTTPAEAHDVSSTQVSSPQIEVESVATADISATDAQIEAVDLMVEDASSTQAQEPIDNTTQTAQLKRQEKLKKELRLKITKVALLTNPKNVHSWNTFLEPARDYAIATNKVSILYEGLGPKDIPSNIIAPYNKALFSVIEAQIVKNKSILDAVQHIILPAEGGDKVKDRVTNLLNEAMIKAVNEANYDLVYNYASFQPDIARLSRQKVVSITIEALENKWNNNEFEGMEQLANFLSETMGIDFSLDSLLLQSYDDHLTKKGVQDLLNADDSKALLIPLEEAQVDLGDKFKFLQEYFKEKPEVIDNLLKSLIVKAQGEYGVPVSLHKLYNHFGESFPENDRRAYLINAIKNSLQKDSKLNAFDYAQQGQKLQKIYTEIPSSFIIAETMNRVKTLADAKALWNNSDEELKTVLKDTQPQYTALMNAITSYEKGDHEYAAKLFTLLSDKTLLDLARPYLREYITTIQSQVGVYQYTPTDSKRGDMNTQLVYIDLIDNAQNAVTDTASDVSNTEGDASNTEADINTQTDLLGVKVTLVTGLGELYVQSPQNLTEDYGKVATYTVTGRINPNTMEINIPDDQKSGQGLLLPFEKTFGELTKLNLEGDRIIYFTEDSSYTFKRIESEKSDEVTFEDGKFSITAADENNDVKSSHILPIGSIVDFTTNKRRAIQTGSGVNQIEVYPIQGEVLHPSSERPRPMNGFYAPSKHLITFSYNYPLKNGGTLDAVIKCQIIKNDITCAGHNKNWGRQLYGHLVSGKRIMIKEKPRTIIKNR